jgi:hypothetical protein
MRNFNQGSKSSKLKFEQVKMYSLGAEIARFDQRQTRQSVHTPYLSRST